MRELQGHGSGKKTKEINHCLAVDGPLAKTDMPYSKQKWAVNCCEATQTAQTINSNDTRTA